MDRKTLRELPISILAVVFATFLAAPASGQATFHEAEPNNTPDAANSVRGDTRVIGAIAPKDQDAFLWTVSDVGLSQALKVTSANSKGRRVYANP